MKEAAWNFYALHALPGLLLLLTLPVALLFDAWNPRWAPRCAATLARSRTACVLAGAGLFFVGVFVTIVLANVSRGTKPLAVLVAAAVWTTFAAGFSGGALALGRSLTGRDGGTRAYVAGWIVRSLAFLTPVLGALVAAYLVAASLGAPLVALFEPVPKVTTEPSPGSTPAN